MAELKPCPFCGGKASLEHSGIDKTRSRDNGDLITTWRVWCSNCGTEQKGGVSEYVFCKDETLRLMNPIFDGRKKAIEAWNRRAVDTPCDLCLFNPPSSGDGKTCTMCVAERRAEDGK